MADADKYGFDTASFGTTVSVDEAVAMLLGMVDGPVQFRLTHDHPTAEEEELLDGLTFSLAEGLNEEKEQAESDLAEAKAEGQPNEIIDRKRAAVEKARDAIAKAKMFFCDIDDELSKGESSALRTYKTRSSTESTHLTISSLDLWAREKYRIAILSRDASADGATERPGLLQEAVADEKKAGENAGQRTRLRQQEKAIVAKLRDLGFDPKALPRNVAGKDGVKAAVREALSKYDLFDGSTVFGKAWERVLKDGDIAYGEGPPPHKKSMGDSCGGG